MECLLIDDDLDDQEVFLLSLKIVNADIRCFTANDGVEALKLLESDNSIIPKYIFIDVNMPKMGGLECLQRIKELPRLNRSKVFMYSTTSEKRVLEKSKELGADDFLVKPTSPARLREMLSAIIGH
ncbi:MAG TPA: response regulator [Chitinophagaceae bacterium]|jgi:CheY-like chemotaxis protein